MNWQDCSTRVNIKGEEVQVATIKGFECVVLALLHSLVRLAGLATLVMLIIGGFKYLTAGNNPETVESAKKTLTYAVFGLVVVLSSWFIIKFIQHFTGIPVTQFTIPGP